MNTNVGSKIVEIRKKNNLTQKDLSVMLSVTAQAVSKWERNVSIPDIQQLKSISKMFDVSIDYLVGEINNDIDKTNQVSDNKLLEKEKKYVVLFRRPRQFYVASSEIEIFINNKEAGYLHNGGTFAIEVDNKEVDIKLRLSFRVTLIKAIIRGGEILIDCKLSRTSGNILVTTNKASKFISKETIDKKNKRKFTYMLNAIVFLIILVSMIVIFTY